MLNFIAVSGRLTKDPELRTTQNGTSVATFTVAVDRDKKNADGTRDADFINCVAWRQAGEFVSRYFFKGSPIIVTGRLSQRSYKANDGTNRTVYEIITNGVYFAGGKPDKATGFTDLDDDTELPY